MRILYHVEVSTFSKRVRLALAHKGLEVELRDCRGDERNLAEAKRLFALGTTPVLDDDGCIVGESNAIAHYLDVAYPGRPHLFPLDRSAAAEALAITTAVEFAMTTLVDVGTRYFALCADDSWREVCAERMGRAQDAIDFVAARATGRYLAGDAWSAADMWALSATRWVHGMAPRAAEGKATQHVLQMLTLGFQLPETLVAWAKQHESRDDVRHLYRNG